MKSLRLFRSTILLLLPLGITAAHATQGVDQSRVEPTAASTATEPGPVDVQLDAVPSELFDLAFRSVSKMPSMPHIKNRCRAQAKVVVASFELDQPNRALAYIGEIENWERGVGLADYAYYCQQHGYPKLVESYLDQAMDVAREANELEEQSWRRDRILAHVARCRLVMGADLEVLELENKGEPSEVTLVHTTRGQLLPREKLGDWLLAAKASMPTGGLDGRESIARSGAEIFGRFYTDTEARNQVAEVITAALANLPLPIRMDVFASLTHSALEHADLPDAKAWVEEATNALGLFEVSVDLQLPMSAKLAELEQLTGSPEQAASRIQRCLELFEENLSLIPSMDQADCLRPLAEAYCALGEPELAALIYWRTVEVGAENPNARVRAEDLSLTCLSMLRKNFAPEPKLMERLRSIDKALGTPW